MENHAIVLGASMCGIVTARALAEHFDRVTVIERDRIPEIGEHRRGVPQSRHTHGLLIRGAQILEELFPGFSDDVIARGGISGDPGSAIRNVGDGVRAISHPSGLTGLLGDRPTFEGVARARLAALPNVEIVEGTQAIGLMATTDRTRVTGVVTVPDGGDETTERPANLVVDSTGRGSRLGSWLESLGYERPREELVKIDVSYTTRLFRREPDGEWLGAIIPATPGCPRAGALLAVRKDTWIVTLAGYLGEHAPAPLDEFMDYARRLPTPDIPELLAGAEPLDDGLSTKFPASRRLRYEDLQRFPEGLLVTGDAICSFNPVYGQGMTVAATEAIALRETLLEGEHDLAKRFFKRASKAVDVPWSIAVGNDLRIPGVEGRLTPAVRFVNWYVSRLNRVAATDPVVATAFTRVVHMVEPPPSIMKPAIARRVLFGKARPPATPKATREREVEEVGV
ncbi:MAG TPA: hypothetical protein VIH05_02520 [Tepidiformaceae bacterium]